MKIYWVWVWKDVVLDVVVFSVFFVLVCYIDGVKYYGVYRGVLEKDDNELNVVKFGRIWLVLMFEILIIYFGMYFLFFLFIFFGGRGVGVFCFF